jgi:hypothetical protein
MDDPFTIDQLDQTDAEQRDPGMERMWPLDLSLAVLGGLVIYTIATRLPAGDPRWYYNPWLYAAIVPLGVVGASLLLRNVASRFVRRSLQLGFLLSVMVHLLLLIAAFNLMIFAPLWSNSTSGDRPVRAPIRKTVPDYLFSRTDMPQKQPDWSRPVDATTTSRNVPDESRELPPLDITARQLEMPLERPPVETDKRITLTPRNQSETSLPTPASSAGKLARQSLDQPPSVESSIAVPEVPRQPTAAMTAVERQPDAERSSRAARASAASLPAAAEVEAPQLAASPTAPVTQIERKRETGVPRIGSVSTDLEQRSLQRPAAEAPPAGAVPAMPTIAIARSNPDAVRMFGDRSTPLNNSSRNSGAELRPVPTESLGSIVPNSGQLVDAAPARRNLSPAGMPTIRDGNPAAADQRSGDNRRRLEVPEGALAGPEVVMPRASRSDGGAGDASSQNPSSAFDRADRIGVDSRANQGTEIASRGINLAEVDNPAAAARVDLAVRPGPAGLSPDPSRRIGFAISEEKPEIASIDFGPKLQRLRDLGGTPPPAGSEVTGARPFDRRKLRTSGGAAPTPDGAPGPETEEAIERGLAYLAERQNADGSWSLQGHGDPVLIRSNTAATGLCVLAFQGAGYTHQQHQYAETVDRALNYLVQNQQANGDLFRPEDAASNRNAWLYSHGIASLALCEAWGMTRDPDLRKPAQKSIDFIAFSQDKQHGGWRYQPGVSSDTSVTGWMMMALKSAALSGLDVSPATEAGIQRWIEIAQESENEASRYRYNPLAPDTDSQRHGRMVTPTMTAVGLLARLYNGWERSRPEMRSGADYLAKFPPAVGSPRNPKRDTYYWYYATQVMFHMSDDHWQQWNSRLNPILTSSQIRSGANAGSWEPMSPVPDRWAPYAGRIYVTAMNLLSLEVYYRHLPIYEETAK